MSSPACVDGLEALYRIQDCESGAHGRPVCQSVPLARVGPHLVVACVVHRDTLRWYFGWEEKILWLVSD